MNLDASQAAAVDLLCTAPFCILTGGPGTGKTTTLRVALDRMEEAGETVALASPTGKAAKRMSEATGRHASTIHRLLEWCGAFTRNKHNPLEQDVVVIDEASMLDLPLTCKLLEACRPDTRVILVGDADQLPSVGPGRILADLVESGKVPVARLTTVHRSAQESWICRNAPRVLSGEPLELDTFKDFRFVECESAGDCALGVERVLLELGGAAQVLSPQRTTACGVQAINRRLQQTINPPSESKQEWTFGQGDDATVYRQGDRVIQTKNNYQLEVFNGEVGTVEVFNESQMVVDFGDRKVGYTKADAFELDLAYALTIHKSQGSEFPWAVVVVHHAHTYMLTRNLLYTGITRAKKGVVIVGNRAGLRAAVDAKDPPKRNTKLVERMVEALEGASLEDASAANGPAIELPHTTSDVPPELAAAPASNTQQAQPTDDIPW